MSQKQRLSLPLLGRNSVKSVHQSEIKQCWSGTLIQSVISYEYMIHIYYLRQFSMFIPE